MTDALQSAAEYSLWWWPRFADHLWQTTLFVLVVMVASFALRREPARVRHNFWLAASAKFILPASLFVFFAQQARIDSLRFFRPAAAAEQNAVLLHGVTQPASALAFNYEITVVSNIGHDYTAIYLGLTALWLAGCLALLFVWALRRRRILRSLKLGRVVREGREWEALVRAKIAMNWKAPVALVISPLKSEPAVWRVFRPVVVMPETIANQLDDQELEAIMLHELVHVQRRDNLIGNFQLGLCALLWFHPLVWFISRKLFDEREQACDERVMEVCTTPEAYASSILKVVRFCFGWRVAGVTGAASGSNLRRRIENIMSKENTKRTSGVASRVVAIGLVGVALVVLVAAGIYSKVQAVNAGSDHFEQIVLDNGQPHSTIPTTPAGLEQRKANATPSTPPAPPPPPKPDQPDQRPQPADAPQLPQVSQPSQPSAPMAPSQHPNPPVPAQAPQPPTPKGMGVENGTGLGIGRGIIGGVGGGIGRATPAVPSSETAPASAPTTPSTPAAPAPEKDQEKSRSRAGQDRVVKGELIEAPQPIYPEEAKQQKIEGTVTVTVTIGEDGNVVFAKAKSGPEALHQASQQAAYKARFQPTTKDGKPVKVAGVMSYNFVLDKK